MELCFDHSFIQLPKAQQLALHSELRRIAARYMRGEQAGHTLQATALVNEAYANLADKMVPIENKHHFVAIAARQMRRILVDHARKKLTNKRHKNPIMLTLSNIPDTDQTETLELIYIDNLLEELSRLDIRAAHAFELKVFSTLLNREIADLLSVSLATVERDLSAARAWIKSEISQLSEN